MSDDATLTYRGWIIQHATPPWSWDFKYQYRHEDYDGSCIDPKDNRCGHAQTVKGCMEAIDDYEDDHEPEPTRYSDDDYCEEYPV